MHIGIKLAATAMIAGLCSLAPAAAETAATCPADPVLPADLAGWGLPASGKTIYAYGEPRAADWPPLGAAKTALPLHKAESLRYWVAPERAPDVHKYGGMVPIEVGKAGQLVVALDAGAWIDLVQGGAFVKSVGHGHGPACSGIRKMVRFDVEPGRYLLQISNAPGASINAMAVLRD